MVSTYGIDHLDFDIENDSYNGRMYDVVNDTAANHMRNMAIKAMEASNAGLQVSFTVATTPEGLASSDDSAGGNVLDVFAQAKADGVRIDVVNIMAMDYFDHSGGSMADKAISAAQHVHQQLSGLGLDVKIGITPMIGQNDALDEVFTLDDARTLEAFALKTSWVAGLGMWELPRDMAAEHDDLGVAPDSYHSGVAQAQYEFSSIFSDVALRSTSDADVIEGDGAADKLSGLGGNDVINGFDGSDTLSGGDGNDVINGGRGADTLLSGDGKDRFVYQKVNDSNVNNFDHINDLLFRDRIVLRAVDADSTTAGNQNFHLGTDHFTHSKGELIRFYDAGTNTTWFQADTDGDGGADLSIAVHGDRHTFDNFVL